MSKQTEVPEPKKLTVKEILCKPWRLRTLKEKLQVRDSWLRRESRNRPHAYVPQTLRRGKYKGKTLGEVLYLDPYYLIQHIQKGSFFAPLLKKKIRRSQRDLAHQAMFIANRIEYLLPPKEKRDCEFVIIVDSAGVFERFELVKVGGESKPKLARGSKIAGRYKELDLTIITCFANPELGGKRLALCMRDTFKRDMIDKTDGSWANYLMAKSHFNMRNIKSHVNFYWTEGDHELLISEYRKWLKTALNGVA